MRYASRVASRLSVVYYSAGAFNLEIFGTSGPLVPHGGDPHKRDLIGPKLLPTISPLFLSMSQNSSTWENWQDIGVTHKDACACVCVCTCDC